MYMVNKPSEALKGLNILVTRATSQAKPLCKLITQAGGQAIHKPMLDITPCSHHPDIIRATDQLAQYTDIIFISANAVTYGLKALPPLPSTTKLSAVGQQTANTLAQHGYHQINTPEINFSSAGLLATPPLQNMQGAKVLIIRGTDGKETLRTTLLQRGAQVDYMACYQVSAPKYDKTDIQTFTALFENKQIDVITTSSSTALVHLAHLVASDGLLSTPILPINANMSDKAKLLGFKSILPPAQNASDGAILYALCRFALQPENLS